LEALDCSAKGFSGMIGEESEDERIESLTASEEGEGDKGIMKGSVLEGGACTVIGQGSNKGLFLRVDGISIGEAGTRSTIESLLYEAMENLLDGNSEVSQSVSFDTMEERREESVEGAGGFHGTEREPGRDSFPSSSSWVSSSTALDCFTDGCGSIIKTSEVVCSCNFLSSVSEETADASNFAK